MYSKGMSKTVTATQSLGQVDPKSVTTAFYEHRCSVMIGVTQFWVMLIYIIDHSPTDLETGQVPRDPDQR